MRLAWLWPTARTVAIVIGSGVVVYWIGSSLTRCSTFSLLEQRVTADMIPGCYYAFASITGDPGKGLRPPDLILHEGRVLNGEGRDTGAAYQFIMEGGAARLAFNPGLRVSPAEGQVNLAGQNSELATVTRTMGMVQLWLPASYFASPNDLTRTFVNRSNWNEETQQCIPDDGGQRLR